MRDINQEKKAAKDWLTKTKGEMSEDALIYLAATGFDRSENCQSAKHCEEGACYCIQATFPTPDHYHLYLNLRQQYLKWLKLGIIAGSLDEKTFSRLKKERRNLNENRKIKRKSKTNLSRHL